MIEGNNTIHFIWAGGNELIPEEKLERIKAWYLTNPDYQIFLWIDKATTSNVYKRYQDERGIPDKYRFIYLKDITDEAIASPEIRYELDRLQPNYQAASNLIRYSILARFGGAFFENDLTPHEPLARLLPVYDDKAHFKTMIDQRAVSQIGNSAMFASPLSPIMLHIALHAHNNYQNPLEQKWNDPYFYNQYDKQMPTLSCPKKVITECRTGASAVRTALFLSEQIVFPTKKLETYEKRINHLRENYQQINTFLTAEKLEKLYQLPTKVCVSLEKREPTWMKLPVKRTPTLREALRIVAKTLLFEMKELNMLRDLDELVFFAKRSLFTYYREQQKMLIERYFYAHVKSIPRLLPATKDVFIDNYIRALLNHFKEIRYDRDLIPQDFGWIKHTIKSEQLSEIKIEIETFFLKKFMSPLIRSQDNALIESHELATSLKQLLDELAEAGHVLKYDTAPMSWQDLRVTIDYIDVEKNDALNESLKTELIRTVGALTNFHRKDKPQEYLYELMYYLSKRKYDENQAFVQELESVIFKYRKQNNILTEHTKVILYYLEKYITLNRSELISQAALAHLLRLFVSHMKTHQYSINLRKSLEILLHLHEEKRSKLYLMHPLNFTAMDRLDGIEVKRSITDKFKHAIAVKKSRLREQDLQRGEN